MLEICKDCINCDECNHDLDRRDECMRCDGSMYEELEEEIDENIYGIRIN